MILSRVGSLKKVEQSGHVALGVTTLDAVAELFALMFPTLVPNDVDLVRKAAAADRAFNFYNDLAAKQARAK